MADPQQTLIDFASGSLSATAFEDCVYNDRSLETLLSAASAPGHFQDGTTLYHYLISLKYDDPGEVLDAHVAVCEWLVERGTSFTPSKERSQTYELIQAAQPRWLDLDATFLESVLATAPPLHGAELKAWLRSRLLELFKCCGRPPRWIQSPAWPIGTHGPLIFFGQLSVPNYFHDEAAVYVFHDTATGECTCITQVA
ncbi:hypothetical protein [Ottowia thiooxydans]|uniref:hypothetical protein n=1 Tax=Ottowia thiooxydans TaxID=219182 RepID=UPI000686EA17|nr:hypothetical protein [Ottowia thiooxydans]